MNKLYRFGSLMLAVALSLALAGCFINLSQQRVSGVVRVRPASIITTPGEQVRLNAAVYGFNGLPQLGAKPITSEVSGGGVLDSQGIYTATQLGHHAITFQSGDMVRVVPVSVLSAEHVSLVETINQFTNAIENDDVAGAQALLADGAEYLSPGSVPVPATMFLENASLFSEWSFGEVDVEVTADTAVLRGKGQVEIALDGDVLSTSDYKMTFTLTAGPTPQIVAIQFDPLEADHKNPPVVKISRVNVPPKGTKFRPGDMFTYSVDVVNQGGPGYFVFKDKAVVGQGSSASIMDPMYIGSRGRDKQVSGKSDMPVYEWHAPGTITYEVTIYSGPTPTNMAQTDHFSITYDIVK